MKKNQVNNIFLDDVKRHNKIISYVIVIAILFIISIAFLILYISKNKYQYIKYNEKSDVEYNVTLKDNKFYETNKLEKDNQYISELIDYINANFKYNLSLEKKDVEYKYSYRIEANVSVKDRSTNRYVYQHDEPLVKRRDYTTKEDEVLINEKVTIDYNKYNDLITDFISTYKLNDTENVLRINLYVNVIGSCDDFNQDAASESITTLEIPLTNRTMAIDITNNLVNNDDNIMICSRPSPYTFMYIIAMVISLVINAFCIYKLIAYIRRTRTAKTVYEKELKKILNNYRSYIQKINSKFKLDGYQSLKVDNFTDMLEIRDTTNQPILMVENDSKSSAYFIIPTNTKLLYIYNIKVSDYEQKAKE